MAAYKCCHVNFVNFASKISTLLRLRHVHQPLRRMSAITTPGLNFTFDKYDGKEFALLSMTNNDNRLSPQFIDDFGTLLSEIERY